MLFRSIEQSMKEHRSALDREERELQSLLMELHGIKVGDRVTAVRGGRTKTYEVRGLATQLGLSKPWLTASEIKRDGTPSNNFVSVWNWTKVEVQP